jgi:hypothetical protein
VVGQAKEETVYGFFQIVKVFMPMIERYGEMILKNFFDYHFKSFADAGKDSDDVLPFLVP